MKKTIYSLVFIMSVFIINSSKAAPQWSCILEDLEDGQKKVRIFKNDEELIYTRSINEGKEYSTKTTDGEDVELICNTQATFCQNKITAGFGGTANIKIDECNFVCHSQAQYELAICHDV